MVVSFGSVSAQTGGDHSAKYSGNVSVRSNGDHFAVSLLKLEGFTIEPNRNFIDESAFINKIDKSLQLLKSRSPDEFRAMQSVIVKIRAARASSANYNEEVMTIDIAKRTFDASLEWLASVLIHETHHIKKYRETGKKLGDAYLMTDKKAALQVMIDEELECNRAQLVVLEKIGGKKYEIDYLRAQKGDHFDIDKDGDYDWDDYNRRNW